MSFIQTMTGDTPIDLEASLSIKLAQLHSYLDKRVDKVGVEQEKKLIDFLFEEAIFNNNKNAMHLLKYTIQEIYYPLFPEAYSHFLEKYDNFLKEEQIESYQINQLGDISNYEEIYKKRETISILSDREKKLKLNRQPKKLNSYRLSNEDTDTDEIYITVAQFPFDQEPNLYRIASSKKLPEFPSARDYNGFTLSVAFSYRSHNGDYDEPNDVRVIGVSPSVANKLCSRV